jgi:hypothetical protein
MREKSLSVHLDYGNFRMVLWLQSHLRILQMYLACMENTLKEYKSIWRIRQEYFAVYGEYANPHKSEPISTNFRPNSKKFLILNHLTGHDRMGKKPSHATVPLILFLCLRT